MTKMGTVRKMCPKKTLHSEHKWWSRQHRMFFLCGGRKGATA
jgi:hypothetical protein